MLSSGCLSRSHRISHTELVRLSHVAPEQRGEKVRVVQNLGHQEDPPEANHVHAGVGVYVEAPIWVDGTPRHHQNTGTGGTSTGSGNVHPGGKSSGKGVGNMVSGKGDSKKADAKAWFVLAAIAAGALAVTEGARYDGWVRVHPMMPVHLFGPYGEYTVLPLASIDERTAQWADHAVIREGEGPWTRLGRAPLNRQGFTYSLFFGSAQVPTLADGFEPDAGFLGHIQFGYFPTKQIGLQLDIGMGWTDDDLGNTIYNSRTSLEVDGYVAQAGPLHAGLFGQIGTGYRADDGIAFEQSSFLYGGGAQLQLELTTRLALTGRAGMIHFFQDNAAELGLGISIY
jgi:hypothetical protein